MKDKGSGCWYNPDWPRASSTEGPGVRVPEVALGADDGGRAAFDFHAVNPSQAPKWIQDRGLEWLFRLKTEARRP
ncbi:MAG: WecB/TagA/CpsF family glycosyltransferase [Rubrobacter sp.]